MGRKNLSKRNSKRRGNKYRNSKRMNSKRRYYKRRTNNYRNTKKRNNKFKNSNRKLKKFIGGEVKTIKMDVSGMELKEVNEEIITYLEFKYNDTKFNINFKTPNYIIENTNTDLITSVRASIVQEFTKIKDSFDGVSKLERDYNITYTYYFEVNDRGGRVELRVNNTIYKDINIENIKALIIKLKYEEMSSV